MPKISIIVPIYKAEQYLSQCINSILAQTFIDFELLLINDGSPDCCGEICENYLLQDNRIKVFHQENAGVSQARNVGIKEAKGEYIVFIDSDDYVLPCYLHDLYDVLPKDGKKTLLIETVTKMYPSGVTVLLELPDVILSKQDKYRILTELAHKNIGYSVGKLYCREILIENNILFLPTVSLLEDFFFLLDYIQYVDSIIVRNISNYIYRVGHSEAVQSVCYKSLEEEYEIFRNFYFWIIRYQQEYRLRPDDLKSVWHMLRIFLHRVLLVLYLHSEKKTYKLRCLFLQDLMSLYSGWVKSYFKPDFIADKVARFFLVHRFYLCFDLWMRSLLALHFKYMFGAKK